MTADSTLLQIKSVKNNKPMVISLGEVGARHLMGIQSLLKYIEGMHDITTQGTKARSRRVAAHNKKTHVKPCNSIVGDFVLNG